MSPSLKFSVRGSLAAACASLAVLILLSLCAAPAVDAQVHSGESRTSAPQSATATLVQCSNAVDQANRSTTFAGQMTAISLTQRMMMRIDVQERAPGETSFHTISAPGLGVWRSSEVGVKIYKYFKQVTNLPAPGEFRGRISFRWMASKDHVLRQAVLHTQSCIEPDERAKLTIGQVLVQPIPASSNAKYQITVRNDGKSTAGPFTVSLNVNGLAQPPLSVSSLAAGTGTVLLASAPACSAGSTIAILPDPQHQVEEAQGGGLSAQISCPLSSSASGSTSG